MSTHALETYLTDLRDIRSTGASRPETSFYPALQNLLDAVGEKLKPRVRCVSQLADTGAGSPDFGLFTASQFQRANDSAPLTGQKPERGVVEVKSFKDDSFVTAGGEQVSKYWRSYNQVLVTNFRDFVLIGHDPEGRPALLETFRLAENEAAFQEATAHPQKTTKALGDRFVDFLSRVLRHAAPLTSPEDLAWFLASYAREAKGRIEDAAGLPGLTALREALEEALGLKFEGEEGEHFFRATLVQTLFYGVFSSWVLWARDQQGKSDTLFDWHAAGWDLHVPMIASLFEQIATRTRLQPLGIDVVLDWTGMALNRVDRTAFFQKFEEEHAVQYFYEPFLKAYDPQLRKELGVWYTPPEIVQYQVARVDTVLREELGLADGLAHPDVVVLDPCCGTGAYLVEVLKKIHETLEAKGGHALVAQQLKQAAMKRVFGFEIIPAPFVVAHLQLGLMLRKLGAPLSDDKNERVGVYLTNSLTGWEPPSKPKTELPFPEFQVERDLADRVKRAAPILVVLGNPPYNAYAGTSPEEEGGLVEPYKEGLTSPVAKGGWGIKKFNLDDLYVRFFRIAERRIVKSGEGIISYISNFSYLGDPSFVVMRKRFLDEFDKIWIDCMNGDSRETGKLTPEGKPDPSVFSTEQNREGIRVGTAVCVMVRRKDRGQKALVRFRSYWGSLKRQELLASAGIRGFDRRYERSSPSRNNRFSFQPATVTRTYSAWPKVTEMCALSPMNGLMEKRGGSLIDIDRDLLTDRMAAYFDPKVDWEQYQKVHSALTLKQAGFEPTDARRKALTSEAFQRERVVRYALRPFEARWCYYSSVPSLWNRSRPPLWAQCWRGNSFLMTRPAGVASPEGVPFCWTTILGDNDFLRGHSYYIPLQVKNGYRLEKSDQSSVFELIGEKIHEDQNAANLSSGARKYLRSLHVTDPDSNSGNAVLVWMHILAIGYSTAYLSENSDGVRQDWPRIPLPDSKKLLISSAALGRQVAALLDTETPVEGVTSGKIRPELRQIATITRVGGGALNPDAGDLDLTAGWGHGGKGGVTMPGKGRYTTRKAKTEKSWPREFGDTAYDIYLNDRAYWSNIPAPVWEYTIGGYQVMKKWLSYREKPLLGRAMKMEEVLYVTEMARRLAALVLLQPALDANYEAVKSDVYPWPV